MRSFVAEFRHLCSSIELFFKNGVFLMCLHKKKCVWTWGSTATHILIIPVWSHTPLYFCPKGLSEKGALWSRLLEVILTKTKQCITFSGARVISLGMDIRPKQRKLDSLRLFWAILVQSRLFPPELDVDHVTNLRMPPPPQHDARLHNDA